METPINLNKKSLEDFEKEKSDLITQFNEFAKKHDKLIHGVMAIKYPNSSFMLGFISNQTEMRRLNDIIS